MDRPYAHVSKTVHVFGQRVQTEDLVSRKGLGPRRDGDVEWCLLGAVEDELEPPEERILVGHVEVEFDGRP